MDDRCPLRVDHVGILGDSAQDLAQRYRQLGFQKNKGLRIDHILASEPMKARATGCFVARDERRMPKDKQKPSDHAPVVATFRSASS